MSLHRFFLSGRLPEASEAAWETPLSERDLHHARTVLRLQPGDSLVLGDRAAREATCVVVSIGPGSLVVDVGEPVTRPAGPAVSLAQGLARRERMEFVIQKATELGVAEIVPVAFARSVVHLEGQRADKRVERWRVMAEESAKQAQRTLVPDVLPLVRLRELIAYAAGFDLVLVPWEEAISGPVPGIGEALRAHAATSASRVLVVIGPEGGLEAAEVEALVAEVGAVTVGLGSTILRTETAGVVAVALAIYELGGLGGIARG